MELIPKHLGIPQLSNQSFILNVLIDYFFEIDKLRVQFLSSEATLPKRSHDDDAGLDLYACMDGCLSPGRVDHIATGLCLYLPKGTYGLVCSRSGHVVLSSIMIISGIIDSGYRGEIHIMAINLGKEDYHYRRGERIAQLVVQPYQKLHPVLDMYYDDKTTRSVFGLGSTGDF